MNNDDAPFLQARILSIKTTLSAAASWRLLVAQKHPGDPRNQLAADLLTALAGADFSTLPADLLTAIAACPNLRQAASYAAKGVGFHTHPGTPAEFIEDTLASVLGAVR